MMRGERKTRGLASRPSTANQTRSTTSMSGGKLVSMNGDAFVVVQKPKALTLTRHPLMTSPAQSIVPPTTQNGSTNGVSQHSELTTVCPWQLTGYKKYPKASSTNFQSTTKSSFTDPTSSLRGKKKLEPYRPDSARSRLPVRFKGEPKPFTRHCKANNESQFHIGAPDVAWESWKKQATVKKKRPFSAH